MEILTTGAVEIAASGFRHTALFGARHYTSVIKPIGTENASIWLPRILGH